MDEGPGLRVRDPSAEDRWLPSPVRRTPSRLVAAAASTIVFHLVLLVGTGWLDQYRRIRATAEQEVPVEVVDEVPQPQTATSSSATTSAAAGAEAASQAQPQSQVAPAESKAPPPPLQDQAKATPQVKPADSEHQQEITEPKLVEPEVSRGNIEQPPSIKPDQPPTKNESETGAEKAAGIEVPAPPSDDSPLTEVKVPPYPSEREAATAEFRIVPKTFRGAALPGAARETEDSYKSLVFGMLERSKQIPAGARARGARGAALVSFQLDRAGNLVSAALVRSSGDGELDVEALALVRRAAPFPKPPIGVLLSFTPVILFSEDDEH